MNRLKLHFDKIEALLALLAKFQNQPDQDPLLRLSQASKDELYTILWRETSERFLELLDSETFFYNLAQIKEIFERVKRTLLANEQPTEPFHNESFQVLLRHGDFDEWFDRLLKIKRQARVEQLIVRLQKGIFGEDKDEAPEFGLGIEDLGLAEIDPEVRANFNELYRNYVLGLTKQLYANFCLHPNSSKRAMIGVNYTTSTFHLVEVNFIGLTLFYSFTKKELELNVEQTTVLKANRRYLTTFLQDYVKEQFIEKVGFHSKDYASFYNTGQSPVYNEIWTECANKLQKQLELD